MRKSNALFHLLNQTRRLRRLLLLTSMLVLPIGAWADDDYSKTIYVDSKGETVYITSDNAADILGDGGSMSYDADNNVLTLDNVNLSCTTTDAIFISCVDWSQDLNTLTIHLVGNNTITLGNNSGFFYGSALTFTTDDNYPGFLTITKEDGWSGKLFENSASGDPTITPSFNNHLYIDHDVESECLIQFLTPPGILSYNDGNNMVFCFGYETGNDDEEIHYSIDYVDENLQDVTDAVYDVSGNDQPLLGPCTMTYYITAGGGQSETMTAKLFGLATNSVTTTLGTPVAPPTIVPAFEHSEDLIITETSATAVAPVYDGTTGLISTSATGETTCSVKLRNSTANGYDYLVLNDNDDNEKHVFGSFTLTVNEVYDLWICGIQVTSANKDDILGDGKWSFRPIEGAWTINQLTFSGVSIENYSGNVINSNIDLTVVVEGSNTISCAEGYYPFYSTNGAQFDFDANSEGSLTGTNRKPFSDNCDYHFGEKGSDPNITGPTLYFTQNGYTIASGTNHWDVSINSNALYSQNYSDVFGDGTVSVSDNADTETFTITLNEANFKGPVCTEAYNNVVVNLTGVNYIKNTDNGKKPFSRSYGGDYTLTFTGDGELRIIDASITSADDAFANNTNTFNDIDCSVNFTTGGWAKEYVTPATGDSYLRIYKAPTNYNVWVYGTQVTSENASNITNAGILSGTVTFAVTNDPTNNEEIYTLTLENASIDQFQSVDAIAFDYPKLTVQLIGENHIQNGFAYPGTHTNPAIVEFISDGGEENCLIFDNAETEEDLVYGANSIYSTGFSNCTYNEISDATGWTIGKDANNHVKLYREIPTPYDLWIGEWQVTSTNAGNLHEVATNRISVGEGGSVTFDANTSTLTLVNATINDQIESSLSSLTIQISGTNTISAGVNACIRSTDETAPLIFTTSGTAEPSLTLTNNTQSPDIPSVIVGFASLSNVYLSWGDNVSGYHVSYDGTKRLVTNYAVSTDNSHNVTLSPILEVAGTSVTSANAGDVFGDGTVSFAPADAANNTVNTLTLNNANLTGGIIWHSDDEDLTISIKGNNSIDITQSNSAVVCICRIGSGDETTLNFERGDANNACVLNLTCDPGVSYFITGFNAEPSADMYVIPITDDNGEQYSTTITSSPFSGGDGKSAATAFKISTPQDLKNLSTLYNAGDLYRKFYELTTDIDCDNLTGFVPIADTGSQSTGGIFEGSFDGNNHKISNLTVTVGSANNIYGGLFGYIGYPDGGSSGTIVKNLTLENCTIGDTDYCGAIAGHIEGGTISGCTVTGCTISGTKNVGGIVGKCDDSDVTISGCKVTGTTRVSCVGADIAYAGALIGNYSSGTLSSNTYEYAVTTSTTVGNNEAEVRKEYTTRGTGVEDENGCYDILTDNGAILYAHKVTIVGDNFGFEGDDGYVPLLDSNSYYIAPGQESTVSLFPNDNFTVGTVTLTYTLAGATEATVETLSNTAAEAGHYSYTYTMPDADATLDVTLVPDAPAMYGEPIVDADGVTLILATETTGTIKYSIDYVDANETDVTDATYDASNKPTISKPATVTAYVTVGDQSSATVTGKYYAYAESKVAGALVDASVSLEVPDIVPTITGADGITTVTEGNVLEGKVTLDSYGSTMIITTLTPGQTTEFVVLNRNISCEFMAVPEVPTLTSDVYLEGENIGYDCPDGTVAIYTWTDTEMPGHVYTHTDGDGFTVMTNYAIAVPAPQESGTLRIWAAYPLGNNTYIVSDELTQVITLTPNIANAVVVGLPESATYTAAAIVPEFTLKVSDAQDAAVIDASNYEVTYEEYYESASPDYSRKLAPARAFRQIASMVNAGVYKIVISGKGAYGGTKEVEFTIDQADLANVTIADIAPVAYDGNEHEPALTVTLNGNDVDAEEYRVSYKKNGQEVTEVKEAGTYEVVLTAIGYNFEKATTATKEFTILNSLDVTFVGSNLWATCFATENLEVPENLTAYVVSEVNENTGVVLVESVGYLPKDEVVLMKRVDASVAASGYAAALYAGQTSLFTNKLTASTQAVDVTKVAAEAVYVLYNDAFKRATSGTIPAGRGFLLLGEQQMSRLTIVEGTTAIGTLTLSNGNDSWYSVDGRKLNGEPQRAGLYIKNGKKIFVTNNK